LSRINVNPTRMELSNLKKKLNTARRGHKLLKDKRDELMRRFLEMVKENEQLRLQVESGISEAQKHFVVASSVMQGEQLNTALLLPKQKVDLNVENVNVMSVEIPVFKTKYKSLDENDIYSYGFGFTSFDLDNAVSSLNSVFPQMIQLAQTEKSCQLLADEIERTRRRVNALEHIMIPRYEETIKYITMKLDENERSTTTRLMKVKDMMIEQSYANK